MNTKPILGDSLECDLLPRRIALHPANTRKQTRSSPKVSLLTVISVEGSYCPASIVETNMGPEVGLGDKLLDEQENLVRQE